MATVTGLTAERMLEIEAASVVDGEVDGSGDLILTTHGGTPINAGHVKGADGEPGEDGEPGPPGDLVVGNAYLWPGSSEPPEFLIPLDGRTLTNGVSEYSALAAMHPEWISGDNLILPDWRNRFVVGAGDDYDAGDVGGSEEHSHNLSDSGYAYIRLTNGSNGVIARRVDISPTWTSQYGTSGSYSSLSSNSGTATPLGGETDIESNIPPYVAGTWCVCAVSTIGEYDPVVQSGIVSDLADHENRIDDLEDVVPGTSGIPFRSAAGSVSGVTVNGGSVVTTTITFPAGRFTQPPIVVPVRTNDFRDITVGVDNVSTASFDLRRCHAVASPTRNNVTAAWIAIQMTSGSGAG